MPSDTTYTFEATITLLPSENGGRRKPVFNGYRPSFAFNTLQHYSGEIRLIGRTQLNPGETTRAKIKLLPAKTIRKNIRAADSFTINEGGRVVGTGGIQKVALA